VLVRRAIVGGKESHALKHGQKETQGEEDGPMQQQQQRCCRPRRQVMAEAV
jgi:hypothetical protein